MTHNLFLVFFVILYMFRAYLSPSSGGTSVCIQPLELIILFRRLFVVLVGLESNPSRTTENHLKIILSTNCCIHTDVPPDDGLRYARNMYSLTKNTKNKLYIKLVFLYKVIELCFKKMILIKVSCWKYHSPMLIRIASMNIHKAINEKYL
jgi:hypothetical protein